MIVVSKNIIGQFKQIKETTKDDSKHPYFTLEIISAFDDDITTFRKSFEEFRKKAKEEADLTIAELEGGEDITDLESIIKKLFQVGTGLSFEEKINVVKEGEFRYRNGIPPGYEDARNKEGFKQYGDLFIWKEILEKAKECNCPIIFVINDLKRDWWDNTDRNNRKPREELVEELFAYSGQTLYMYDVQSFFSAGIFRKMTVSELILKEVEEVIGREQEIFSALNQTMTMRFHKNFIHLNLILVIEGSGAII
ncbi:MAG: hypothetical protein IPJ74_15805 [Saprospiraceae bacterium]|nr:hypothetical protein [Saprospiraceae bacterium]